MKLLKLSVVALVVCAYSFGLQNCFAQDEQAEVIQHSWKDTNNQAIQAMRNENYAQAERLFQQALTECNERDVRETIQDNLNVLLEKEGKRQAARVEKDSNISSPAGSSGIRMDGNFAEKTQNDDVHKQLSQLEAEIKKADSVGDLENLQALFQKKLKLLVIRDGSETLDYAYCLHFRAQVLRQLHRDDEADRLEARGAKLRDQLRQLTQEIRPLQLNTKSTLRDLSFKQEPPPNNRPITPYQESYAPVNSTSGNLRRNVPRMNRGFMPTNPGDTSGYLNGNPNATPFQ